MRASPKGHPFPGKTTALCVGGSSVCALGRTVVAPVGIIPDYWCFPAQWAKRGTCGSAGAVPGTPDRELQLFHHKCGAAGAAIRQTSADHVQRGLTVRDFHVVFTFLPSLHKWTTSDQVFKTRAKDNHDFCLVERSSATGRTQLKRRRRRVELSGAYQHVEFYNYLSQVPLEPTTFVDLSNKSRTYDWS
eukprot:gene24313-biopygen20890